MSNASFTGDNGARVFGIVNVGRREVGFIHRVHFLLAMCVKPGEDDVRSGFFENSDRSLKPFALLCAGIWEPFGWLEEIPEAWIIVGDVGKREHERECVMTFANEGQRQLR